MISNKEDYVNKIIHLNYDTVFIPIDYKINCHLIDFLLCNKIECRVTEFIKTNNTYYLIWEKKLKEKNNYPDLLVILFKILSENSLDESFLNNKYMEKCINYNIEIFEAVVKIYSQIKYSRFCTEFINVAVTLMNMKQINAQEKIQLLHNNNIIPIHYIYIFSNWTNSSTRKNAILSINKMLYLYDITVEEMWNELLSIFNIYTTKFNTNIETIMKNPFVFLEELTDHKCDNSEPSMKYIFSSFIYLFLFLSKKKIKRTVFSRSSSNYCLIKFQNLDNTKSIETKYLIRFDN